MTFSHKKTVSNLWKFKVLLLMKTDVKFRNLKISKLLTPIQTKFFQFLSRLSTYLSDIYSLKNDSEVRRSGYFYRVNWKLSLTNDFLFSKLKVLLWNLKKKKKKKSLLPKSTLKYQLCYQPFWVEIRFLQIQCISIWALVFYYCISNNFKKLQYNCNDIKKVSQNIFSNKIWTFLYKKSLSRNMFIVVLWFFFFLQCFLLSFATAINFYVAWIFVMEIFFRF